MGFFVNNTEVINDVPEVSAAGTHGAIYPTITIGTQTWMARNLDVTHYNDGTPIPCITDDDDWIADTVGAYVVYDNDFESNRLYGKLYNWYAVDHASGLAPNGWHVPSDDEFKTLEMYLGMSESEADDTGLRGTNEGSKLAGSSDLWNDHDLVNNSEFGTSGFNTLPSGYRFFSTGYYTNMGNDGYFWSSSEVSSSNAWTRTLHYNTSAVYRAMIVKNYGFSIRCIRDT